MTVSKPVSKQDSRDIRDVITDAAQNVRAAWRELAKAIYLGRIAGLPMGTVAHDAIMSTHEAKIWAKVIEVLGPDAIELDVPLSYNWWEVLLATPDPKAALYDPSVKKVNARKLRKQLGVQMRKKKPAPLYRGSARVVQWGLGVFKAHVALDADPPEPLPKNVRLEIKSDE